MEKLFSISLLPWAEILAEAQLAGAARRSPGSLPGAPRLTARI
jgi:hypothetical protein